MIKTNNYLGKENKKYDIPYRVMKNNSINDSFNIDLLDPDIKKIFNNKILESAYYAINDENNNYHFELNTFDYIHFTSPIRRIIDTFIHWCITYKINFKSLNIDINKINELAKNTKKYHNDINLLNIINNLPDEVYIDGWIYKKNINKNRWTVYFRELGFRKVKMWDNKLEYLNYHLDLIENIHVGHKYKFIVYKKNGFLPNEKILIILV